MNRILLREEFLKNKKNLKHNQKVNELLSNEINWGDSLVGRLINSIGRKGKIGWNLRKIGNKDRGLLGQLNSTFEIIRDSVQLGINADDIRFLTTMELLKELENLIDIEENVDVIISHLDHMIYQIGTYNLQDRDIMIKALNDFKDFLEEEGEEEGEEVSELDSGVYFSNLKLLRQLIAGIGSVKLEGEVQEEPDTTQVKTVEEDEEGIRRKLQPPNIVIYRRSNGEVNKGIVVTSDLEDGRGNNTGQKMVQLDSFSDRRINENRILESYGIPLNDIIKVMDPLKKGMNIGFKKNGKALTGVLTSVLRNVMTIAGNDGNTYKVDFEDDFMILKSNQKVQQKTPEQPQQETPPQETQSPQAQETQSPQAQETQSPQAQETSERKSYSPFRSVGTLNESEEPSKEEKFTVISKGDAHASKASKALVNYRESLSLLVSSKEKALGVDIPLLDSIIKHENEEDVQKMVGTLYEFIWSFLYGKRKDTFNINKTPLFESDSFISEYRIDVKNGYGVGKLQTLAEKIARFSYKTLQFKNNEDPLSMKDTEENITASFGGYGKILSGYNSSLFQILSNFTKIDRANKTDKEEVQESNIKTYKGFRRIFEENESVDYASIRDKYDELFNPRVKPMFTLSNEVSERLKNLQSTGRLVLRSPDPIIEIVRIFHRAWRLHTPGVIPSGRTGGKVSNSVFQEYEYLGDGGGGTPDSPGGGPYRNIKIWDTWLYGVQDILQNTDFRNTIFSSKCEFAFEDTRDKPEPIPGQGVNKDNLGEKFVNEANENETQVQKEPAKQGETTQRPLGKILLRFINRLLSDTKMYQRSGALPQFIDEYFDLDDEWLKKNLAETTETKKDIEANQKVAEVIVRENVLFQEYSKVYKKLVGTNKEYNNIFDYLRDVKDKPPTGLCFRVKNVNSGEYNYFILKYKYSNHLFFAFTSGTPFDFTRVLISDPSGSELSLSSSPINMAMYYGKGKFGYVNLDGEVSAEGVEIDKNTIEVLTYKSGKAYRKLKLIKDIKFKDNEVSLSKLIKTVDNK